ncbi:hypothetical protein BCV71DRAFT_238778 [Rhizopus microsporus]|uniref:Uncharacterized protein n=1 Tax=Rhizopus microsporus TaxID=58291 RepID=A0A1X0RQ48_RHIZD|nr:hypothetical protein BCV71DRAFT_238778 [Rhizopus microsporus]
MSRTVKMDIASQSQTMSFADQIKIRVFRKASHENGGPEPMEYIADQDEFVVEAIATHSEYLKKLIEWPKDEDVRMKEADTKHNYVRYTIQDKVRFFDLKIEKCMSASAAAKQSGIHIQTARDGQISIKCALIAFLRLVNRLVADVF